MARLTPLQIRARDRVESLIALAAPLLDLMLAVADRGSRLLASADENYPIAGAGESLEPGPAIRADAPDDVLEALGDALDAERSDPVGGCAGA
jgi:hypothetical protein